MKKNKSQSGQSLFEVVVAVAISALIITAIVSLTAVSIQNSSFSKDKALATNYVQATNEWLRQERDRDSTVFVGKAKFATGMDVTYCLSDLVWPVNPGACTSAAKITDTNFIREVIFPACTDFCSDKVVEVKVQVYWQDSKGYHEVSSTTNLSIQ